MEVILVVDIRDELFLEARKSLGVPFRSHYMPGNVCEGGSVTVDHCMDVGMDEGGYDCSGLVVASMSRVLGLPTDKWPRQYRHARQLSYFRQENSETPVHGDVVLMSVPKPGDLGRMHIGFSVDEETVLHASARAGKVVESEIPDSVQEITVFDLPRFVDTLSSIKSDSLNFA